MIEVAITSTGIHMNGHANRSVNGQDIVCAAISALTCNLINSLEELTPIPERQSLNGSIWMKEDSSW